MTASSAAWAIAIPTAPYFQNGIPWGATGVPGVGSLILFDNGAKDRLLQLGVAAQKPYTRDSRWSATISYTLSFADQNNLAGGSNPYSINSNQYLFDLPYASLYPFVRGTAVPVNRIVATYSRDLFWGLSAATKVELATPNYASTIFGCATACNIYGGEAMFVSQRPNGFLGYKEVDLQITKDVTFLSLGIGLCPGGPAEPVQLPQLRPGRDLLYRDQRDTDLQQAGTDRRRALHRQGVRRIEVLTIGQRLASVRVHLDRRWFLQAGRLLELALQERMRPGHSLLTGER